MDTPAPRRLAACTLRELAEAAQLDPEGEGLAFRIADRIFLESGRCARCGRAEPLNRLAVPGKAAGHCPACGGLIFGTPFYAHNPIPAALVRPLLDQPLARLGVSRPGFVVVRGPDQAALFRAGSHQEHKP